MGRKRWALGNSQGRITRYVGRGINTRLFGGHEIKKLIPAIVCIVLIGSVAMAAAPQQQNKTAAKEQKAAVKRDLKDDKRDLKQDQAEMTRLREDLKAAEAAGDRARIARDRAAIHRLEAHMRADREEINDDKAEAKAAGKQTEGPKSAKAAKTAHKAK